jgi:tRNA-2-methylthio-N6-dimethylallyladenosine synthase
MTQVLVEGPSKSAAKRDTTADAPEQSAEQVQMTGRTHDDRIVVFDGPETLAGTFVAIRVDAVTPTTLIGTQATQETIVTFPAVPPMA